jgi:hypothetical protein
MVRDLSRDRKHALEIARAVYVWLHEDDPVDNWGVSVFGELKQQFR